jgi:hypothetical protein
MAMGRGVNRRLKLSQSGGLARRGWAEFARQNVAASLRLPDNGTCVPQGTATSHLEFASAV